MKPKYTYEYAHKECHPETCSCRMNYRILHGYQTVGWAASAKEAELKVRKLEVHRDTEILP